MTATTKKYLIWGAVIVGAVILWKKMNATASSGASTGAATGGVLVGATATATPANAGAKVPTDATSGLNPSK